MNSTTKRRSTPRSNGKPKSELVSIPPTSLRPAEENDALYRPIDLNDPEFQSLVQSVREQGILEPLVVTRDRVVVSGHRRRAAAIVAGIKTVRCRVLPMNRRDPRFLRVLREFNRQRVKTLDEMLREVVVEASADEAYQELRVHRFQRSWDAVRLNSMALAGHRGRASISAAKQPFLDAVLRVLDEMKEYLPISERTIHYQLLNDPPLIHASKPDSRYDNTRQSAARLSDLVTRARIEGLIPMDAISDETRPVETWDVHRSVQPFIRREVRNFLRGYWRNLQQSQPNHVEIIGEKNTLSGILSPIAAEFCIPMTLGRGFCSLPPRYGIVERFRSSGKHALVLLILADFDPDGEVIAESFARSIRDDFGVEPMCMHAVKVALTAEQTQQMDLPPALRAKTASRRGRKFVERHGHDVWELEALKPEVLQGLLRDAILGVLDIRAYNRQMELERDDAKFLHDARQRALAALRGIMEAADNA